MNLSRCSCKLVLAFLVLSSVAFADQIDDIWFYGNTGGTVTFNPSTQTMTLTSSITETISGTVSQTGNLGTLTVTTGPLMSGSILHHAAFSVGTITISFGIGSISGTLGPLSWYQVPNSDEFHLAGAGAFDFSQIVNFDQLVVPNGTNQFTVLEGKVGLAPEPSTLSLVVSGLAVLSGAGVVRFQKRRLLKL